MPPVTPTAPPEIEVLSYPSEEDLAITPPQLFRDIDDHVTGPKRKPDTPKKDSTPKRPIDPRDRRSGGFARALDFDPGEGTSRGPGLAGRDLDPQAPWRRDFMVDSSDEDDTLGQGTRLHPADEMEKDVIDIFDLPSQAADDDANVSEEVQITSEWEDVDDQVPVDDERTRPCQTRSTPRKKSSPKKKHATPVKPGRERTIPANADRSSLSAQAQQTSDWEDVDDEMSMHVEQTRPSPRKTTTPKKKPATPAKRGRGRPRGRKNKTGGKLSDIGRGTRQSRTNAKVRAADRQKARDAVAETRANQPPPTPEQQQAERERNTQNHQTRRRPSDISKARPQRMKDFLRDTRQGLPRAQPATHRDARGGPRQGGGRRAAPAPRSYHR